MHIRHQYGSPGPKLALNNHGPKSTLRRIIGKKELNELEKRVYQSLSSRLSQQKAINKLLKREKLEWIDKYNE